MQAAHDSPAQATPDVEPPQLVALRAAGSALPFASALAKQVAGIVAGLRRGDDTLALTALADATDNLSSFLSFLILIDDLLDSTSRPLTEYRRRLTAAIEGTGPALAHNDFVEVADSLGEDLLPLLEEYPQLDLIIVAAIAAAPTSAPPPPP